MKRSFIIAIAIAGAAALSTGCSTAPKEGSDRATLSSESTTAIDAFRNDDPSLQDVLNRSVGYAIFPDVGKAGFIAGASYGKGEVFEGGKKVGYADITQGSFGLQAGAQTFSELVIFFKPGDFDAFKKNTYSIGGNVSAVAIKAGAAQSADTTKGVVVFVRTKGGLMAEASVSGQRFRFTPLSGEASTKPSMEASGG